MLDKLEKHNRLNEAIFLACLSALCFSMFVFRYEYSQTKHYLFLNWNLFLAFIPWSFSTFMIINPQLKRKKPVIIALLMAWLIFFPNAPYLLTDLFHLKHWSSMPKWFDLILILSFAWTGLLFGFMSLWDIENLFKNRIKPQIIPVISSLLLFVVSYGVYLGRYRRWNSWDIIKEPFGLMDDISDSMLDPSDYPKALGVTLFLGLFLNIMYWSFRLIKKRDEKNSPIVSEK